MNNEYEGKTLLCRTLFQTRNIFGRISFSESSIAAKLVGFENYVFFEDNATIPLQLENNQFCTVTPATVSPGTFSTAGLRNHQLEVDVRQAIIGFRPWAPDDLIQELHFSISNTNGFLTAPDIQNEINKTNFGETPNSTILEVEFEGISINLFYSYTFSWNEDTLRARDAVGTVTFKEAANFEKVGSVLSVLTTFLTTAAGVKVSLGSYKIVPKEDSDQHLIGGGTAPANFELYWPGNINASFDKGGVSGPSSLLRCWEKADRKVASDCLQFWMDNWTEWEGAFSGLYVAVREGNTFDPHRIISACKWLEVTPGAKQQKIDRKEQLTAISEAATTKASDLGMDLQDRLVSAIERLGTESRNALLKRLINIAVPDGDAAFKARFLKDLHLAYRVRGHFAHTSFEHSDDQVFDDYVRVTQAIEALAYMLLFRQLPLPRDHPWPHGAYNLTEYFLNLR